MKKVFFFIILCSTILSACKNDTYRTKPGAHGNAGNILIVMENNLWNSEPGDSIRAIFHQFCRALPRSEYLFTLHQIEREKFIEHNRYHRNIIYTDISPDLSVSQTGITRDKYSRRQLFVNISAQNQKEFVQELSKYKDRLVKLFLDEDRDRYLFHVRNHTNKTVSEMLRNKHEIILQVPRNYTIDENKDNFVWISFETAKYIMGIFIYHYPYTDTSSLDYDYLINMRNKILKENVPGEVPGSYMTTEVKFYPPYLDIIEHNKQKTAYIQGLWRVQGDFMGGPFVNYTKIDHKRNRIVSVEGFVFYPNQEHRDMIRRLDAILYTFDLI